MFLLYHSASFLFCTLKARKFRIAFFFLSAVIRKDDIFFSSKSWFIFHVCIIFYIMESIPIPPPLSERHWWCWMARCPKRYMMRYQRQGNFSGSVKIWSSFLHELHTWIEWRRVHIRNLLQGVKESGWKDLFLLQPQVDMEAYGSHPTDCFLNSIHVWSKEFCMPEKIKTTQLHGGFSSTSTIAEGMVQYINILVEIQSTDTYKWHPSINKLSLCLSLSLLF